MYLDRFKLQGKTAVVTGAARGIGLAIVDALSEAGAAVVLTDMDGEAAQRASDALARKGRAVTAEALDVTDPRMVEQLQATLIGRFKRIDILVNNAGIAISNRPAETMDDQTWLKVLDVNLNGVFWCCRSFGKTMLESGGGTIVNIGSMSAEIVNRPQEQAQYNASKAGVHHLTRSLAAEWAGRNVRVNAVAPTYIETDLTKFVYDDPKMLTYWIGGTPMGRMGKPDEIASVVLFLASPASSLMTGSIVSADAGYTLW
jgi:NAD(P)-dependent dehydrogenase (short-subunit alcohol dehydrogenase family)